MGILPVPKVNILINILLAVYVLVALLMLLVILMQRPKSEGLGAAFGGGVTENIFGAQTTNVLTKATAWLAGLFFFLLLGFRFFMRTARCRAATCDVSWRKRNRPRRPFAVTKTATVIGCRRTGNGN